VRGVRLGFLGSGKIALHHAAAFAQAGATIAAAAARDEMSATVREFRARTQARFATPEQLLADPGIDGVIACLPQEATAQWLSRLLASPKPILIEKPILPAGLDVAQSNKLVGYNRRFYRTVASLKERLSQGGLIAVHATFPGDLYGAAIHGLDLLFFLLGPLTWKHAGRNGLAVTPAGVPVSLAINADDPVNAGIRAVLDDGTSWLLSPFETLSVFKGFDVAGTTIRRYSPRLIMRIEETDDLKPGFLAQSRAFLSGEFGPGARPAESVQLMEFVGEIR
jgi:Oxidoreductase family, NAD-binding Rossmann fold